MSSTSWTVRHTCGPVDSTPDSRWGAAGPASTRARTAATGMGHAMAAGRAADRHHRGADPSRVRCQLTVTGLVQGVGFRPYVYALARELGLPGSVANAADGVIVE